MGTQEDDKGDREGLNNREEYLDPVIKSEQTFEIIERTHDFVETYKVGNKWNRDKEALFKNADTAL